MGPKVTQPWFVSGDGNSLSQTRGVPGVRWPSASLALPGGAHGEKPRSEMGLVFMLEADEQVAGLFLFRGFTSTSESDLLVPQMGRPSSALLGGFN